MAQYPTHTDSNGKIFRSKTEIIIDQQLTMADLDHEYERPLGPFRPDFTIWYNDKVWYWEHLGLLDDKNYHANWLRKEQWYREQGHWDRLIITKERNGSLDLREITIGIAQIKMVDSLTGVDNIPDRSNASTTENEMFRLRISVTCDDNRDQQSATDHALSFSHIDPAVVPDNLRDGRFRFDAQRDDQLVFVPAPEGPRFLPMFNTPKLLNLRFHVVHPSPAFLRMLREYCCGAERIASIETEAQFTGSSLFVKIPSMEVRKANVASRQNRPRKTFSVHPPETVVEPQPQLNETVIEPLVSAAIDDQRIQLALALIKAGESPVLIRRVLG